MSKPAITTTSRTPLRTKYPWSRTAPPSKTRSTPTQLTATSNSVCDFTQLVHLDHRLADVLTSARDDNEAIDESNIIEGGRTRGAAPEGGYAEPGDTEVRHSNIGLMFRYSS